MLLDDFIPHGDTGVRVPPGEGAPAGYLDGAERYLLDVLRSARDRSVASDELRTHVRDWASHYHLTPYRSTLFDALGFTAGNARVLELGCGCGAVTRWLGEHCAEVHAVEGNVERARVARTRCADLDNVAVYCANYSELEEHGAFDVATLIGVLEYGHLYHPRTDDPRAAATDNLQIVRRALRDDGVLVLAIENKLGLKYFSGAREDHSARPFDSINGYPHATTAVTFSAREIEQMLADAGFAAAEWYVPYPDYKLARTVVNVQAAGDEHRVENWLEGPAPDRGQPRRSIVTFNETLAQREVVRAGLLRDLANSFLVLAYAGEPAATHERLGIETDWVARHYSLDRRAETRKRATLPPAADAVREEHVMAGDAAVRTDAEPVVLGAFEHRFADEPFRAGGLLVHDVLGTVTARGVGDELAGHVRDLGRWLVETYGTGGVDEAGSALVDGAAIDALWWNVVVDGDGAWSAIDGEWRFRGVLPVDYVLWRGLLQLHVRFASYLPDPWRGLAPAAFAAAALEQACGPRPAARLATFAEIEQTFATTAAPGAAIPPAPPAVQHLLDLAALPPRFSVLAFADELAERPALLRAYVDGLGGERDATLLLAPAAAASDDLVERVQAAIAASGVPEEDLPDLLLLSHAPHVVDDPSVTAALRGVLTDRDLPVALDGVPRFA